MSLTEEVTIAGTLLAKAVVASRFRGDHEQALRLMERASRDELAIATEFLAGRLREALVHMADGEENVALQLLHQPNDLHRLR